MAAYFAFVDVVAKDSEFVSVWILDRDVFATRDVPQIEIVDNDEMIQFNSRAIEQRGLFVRVGSVERPLEDMLGDSLTRYDIPSGERRVALTDLDEMLVNSRVLFRDFDGAATTSNQRVLELRGD